MGGAANKKSKVSESNGPTHNALFQSVKALDHSDEDATSLLSSVYELLHVDIHEIDIHDAPAASPIHKWALRWLLRRLALTEGADSSLRNNYQAWALLGYLIRILPYNVTTELAKSSDLIAAFQQALISALADVHRNALNGHKDEQIGANGAAADPHQLPISKKRKRNSTQANSAAPRDPMKCFKHIVQVIDVLQKPSNSSHNGEIWTQQRQAVLTANPTVIVGILSCGLELFNEVIRGARTATDADDNLYDQDLCSPLLDLHSLVYRGTMQGDLSELSNQSLSSCTQPALHLLAMLEDSGISDQLKAKFDYNLRELIANITVHPYRDWHRSSRSKAATNRADDDQNIDILIENALSDGAGAPPSATALAFEVAFGCVRRDNAAQRAREDAWLSDLFLLLMRTKSAHGANRIPLLERLLTTANSQDLQLPNGHVQIAWDAFVNDSGHARWSVAVACIANSPSFFSPRQNDGAISNLENLFKTVSDFKERATARDFGNGSENQVQQTYDLVVLEVIAPLIRILASLRDVEVLLQLWSQFFEEAMPEDRSGHVLEQFLLSTIWVDERLLTAMSSALKSSVPSSQRSDLLLVWLDALGDTESDTVAELQSTILIGCTIAGLDHEGLKKMQEKETLDKVYDKIWHWLKSKSTVSNQKWRGWRILHDLAASRATVSGFSGALEDLEVAKRASKITRKRLKNSSSEAESGGDDPEAVFAWLLLLRLAVEKDSLAASINIKQMLRDIWNKVLSIASKPVEHSKSQELVHHMDIQNQDRLSLHCVLLAANVGTRSPWVRELFSEQALDLIMRRAIDEEATAFGDGVRWSWQEIWRGLDRMLPVHDDLVLYSRLNSCRIQAMAGLPDPKRKLIHRFELVVDGMVHVKRSNITKKDRLKVIEKLNSWLDSELLTNRDHEGVNAKGRGLLQLLNLKTPRDVELHASSDRDSSPKQDLVAETGDELVMLQQLLGLSCSVHDLAGAAHGVLEQKDKDISREDSTTLRRAVQETLRVLNSCKDALSFTVAAQIMHAMLTVRQIPLMGQFQVDEILLMVNSVTSSSTRVLSSDSPDAIYTCLCNLFGSILSDFRHRITGRYHLVLVALKGLLWCLFEPRQMGDTPNWKTTTLAPRCAELFARLLTSLSDPSVSAARVGSKRSDLNDPTKRAKSIAGQHLSQLIISFCKFQLEARLDPELRSKLNPGLYAVMEAMSRDVRQSMVAAMTAPERAVFKSLFDDWRQFGR